MNHCLATSCEDTCNNTCESYICKRGAQEGSPVPGTDGKVCYGELILPQSRVDQEYVDAYYQESIDTDSVYGWNISSTYPSSYYIALMQYDAPTLHLFQGANFPTSTRNTPLGIIKNWEFQLLHYETTGGLVFEFGFLKKISTYVFEKIGIPKKHHLSFSTTPIYSLQSFTIGAENDLWGIPASAFMIPYYSQASK